MDFTTMTGPQLVDAYNSMVATWYDLRGDNTFGTIKRFANTTVGRERCEKLHAAIQAKRGDETGTVRAEPAQAPVQPDAAPVPIAADETAGAAETAAAPESEEDMAKRKTRKAPRRNGNGGPTIREMTEEYNSLVPRASKAGVTWARHHTSLFGSLEAGKAQLNRLKKAISAA